MKKTEKMYRLSASVLSLMIGLSLLAGCGGGGGSKTGPAQKPADQTATIVESRYQEAAVTLDGMDTEEVWMNIQPETVNLESGVTFTMKSFYDNDNIYFLFQWLDLDEGPLSTTGNWFKTEDGNWNWDFKSDGFSIAWDVMKTPKFNEEACTPLCHELPSDRNRRYMGTDNPQDIQEFWNWTPGVSNAKGIIASYLWQSLPAGMSVDDEGFDNRITWGHLPGEYGFYFNRAENEIAPADFISGDQAPLWIINDQEASGDAAVVKAFGMFEYGMYTLEASRPRNPSNRDLHRFTVADNGWADILFAAAIFHNNERDNKKVMKKAATLRLVGKNVE